MNYLKLFPNHTAYSNAENDFLFPNVSYCEQENELHYNKTEYLNEQKMHMDLMWNLQIKLGLCD